MREPMAGTGEAPGSICRSRIPPPPISILSPPSPQQVLGGGGAREG